MERKSFLAIIMTISLHGAGTAFAQGVKLEWTPLFIPPGVPPGINPCLFVLDGCVLDIEGLPPSAGPSMLAVNLRVNPGVPIIPGSTFVAVIPGPLFAVSNTDHSTFLNLSATVPFVPTSEFEVVGWPVSLPDKGTTERQLRLTYVERNDA